MFHPYPNAFHGVRTIQAMTTTRGAKTKRSRFATATEKCSWTGNKLPRW